MKGSDQLWWSATLPPSYRFKGVGGTAPQPFLPHADGTNQLLRSPVAMVIPLDSPTAATGSVPGPCLGQAWPPEEPSWALAPCKMSAGPPGPRACSAAAAVLPVPQQLLRPHRHNGLQPPSVLLWPSAPLFPSFSFPRLNIPEQGK